MEGLIFYYFHVTSLAEHRVPSCGSWCCGVGRRRWSRHKWKPRPLRLPWRLKGTLSLFLLIFGLFFRSVSITFFPLGWRRRHTGNITPHPDLNSRCDRATCFCGSRCSTDHQRFTMKIEPAFHLWKIPHQPRWQTKIMILSRKKAANYSLFSKSSKWTTSGQNVGNS